MNNYVEIIDKNRCNPYVDLTIEGIKANSTEWVKYNFYPQNGIVGELIGDAHISSGLVYIIQVMEKVFVPIDPSGIKNITQSEFKSRYFKNKEIGIDKNSENDNAVSTQIMKDMGF